MSLIKKGGTEDEESRRSNGKSEPDEEADDVEDLAHAEMNSEAKSGMFRIELCAVSCTKWLFER